MAKRNLLRRPLAKAPPYISRGRGGPFLNATEKPLAGHECNITLSVRFGDKSFSIDTRREDLPMFAAHWDEMLESMPPGPPRTDDPESDGRRVLLGMLVNARPDRNNDAAESLGLVMAWLALRAAGPAGVGAYCHTVHFGITEPTPGYHHFKVDFTSHDPHRPGLVAIGLPWPRSPSGLVEWKLVDWTVADDKDPRMPILADEGGDRGAWMSEYAIRGEDGLWTFTDGETSDDAGLVAAFKRREAKH